jgi:hypothetical protein
MSHASRRFGLVVLIGSVLAIGSYGLAQNAAPAKPRGRLPAYYKDIIDAKQRDRIYEIQAEYAAKITPLQEEIKKLSEEREAAIEGVLTAEQKGKLKKVREEATAGRKGKAATPAATEEQPAASE